MQNLKYHIINIIAITVFSYTSATAINQIVRYKLSPTELPKPQKHVRMGTSTQKPTWEVYRTAIIDKEFFKKPTAEDLSGGQNPQGNITELTLLGTITGPWKIARAMIKKTGENQAKVFALMKVNEEINDDVFGYKLVKIRDTIITLESGGQQYDLALYQKFVKPPENAAQPAAGGERISKTISRSEVQQIASGKIDNATQGLRAGPYRVNGQIAGYQLMQVRPYNILYKLGARSGDIIKRVNGKALDSTEKLLSMWNSLQSETRVSIDLERDGKPIAFDYNITD
jgi:general secretion pathway protein C